MHSSWLSKQESFSSCVFEPKVMNFLLSGLNFSMFADNYIVTSFQQFF